MLESGEPILYVVDEPSFCCFIQDFERPERLYLLGIFLGLGNELPPRLVIIDEHEIRTLFEGQRDDGPIPVAPFPGPA